MNISTIATTMIKARHGIEPAQAFVANDPVPPLHSEEAVIFGSTFEHDWSDGTDINEVFSAVDRSVLLNLKKRLVALINSDVLNARATVDIKAYLYDLDRYLASRQG